MIDILFLLLNVSGILLGMFVGGVLLHFFWIVVNVVVDKIALVIQVFILMLLIMRKEVVGIGILIFLFLFIFRHCP
jgi:hypothetical protein